MLSLQCSMLSKKTQCVQIGLIGHVVFGKRLINMGNIGNGIFNHGRMSQVVSRRVVLKTGTTVYQCLLTYIDID